MRFSTGNSNSRQKILSFLGALCLFLSALEYLVPKPLPFFRLGLANLPILLGLRFLSAGDLFLLLILKVLGQGLINGTLASHVFLFSLAGSSASLAVMWTMHRLGGRWISLVGISLFGAMASSLVQLVLAIKFIFGPSARIIIPWSLGSGLLAGLILGMFAMRFARSSQWLRELEARYRGND